jgi:tetratricopeptide (TPR) repeat protein
MNTTEQKSPPAWPELCVCFFLVVAVLAVFGQTAHFGFVNFDDPENVSANQVVQQGLSVKAVGWAVAHAQVCNWIPLTTLSHMLDCQLFGLRAGGHHVVSVLFHAATAVLLFLVLRQMTGSLWRSAFVAALFAVHPLRAESVAWVSERKDVLSAFFFMLAIGAYVRQARRPSRAGPVVVFLLFGLGLLAKSMVATLPFVLLLLDYWPLGRLHNRQDFLRRVREKIPLFALAAGSCVAAVLVPGLLVAHRLPLWERIGNAAVGYAVYLGQMVFPAGLTVLYPNPPNGEPKGKVCLALLLLAAITAGVVTCRNKRPYLLAGWLWYLGMLFPVIGIIQISSAAAHADRYTYLPGIGLVLAATWAVADGSAGSKARRVALGGLMPHNISPIIPIPPTKARRLALGGLMLAAVGALMLCAHTQASYWRNSESLWTRALACTSDNYPAHYNLGNEFVKQGRLDEAIGHFQKALDIQPASYDARYNLANALFRQGKLEDAIAQYRKILALAPDSPEVLNNLGNALATQGAYQDALAPYEKALQIQPGFSDAHYDLGQVLLKLGRFDESAAQFRKALDIEPKNAEAQNGVGEALLLKGDLDGALACFGKTAALSSNPLTRWRSLGGGFLEKGEWDAAIVCYRQATKIDPRSADACADLGMAYLKKGETREAMDSWQQALAINPGQLSVLNNLAWLLATATDPSLRDGARAVALATQASQLSAGGNPVILHTLAVAYAAEGNYRQAATTARRALELASSQKKDALAATLQQEIQQYESNPPPGNAAH